MGCIISLFKKEKKGVSENVASISKPIREIHPATPFFRRVNLQGTKKTYPVSRPKAVRALRHNGSDIVISIMELTM